MYFRLTRITSSILTLGLALALSLGSISNAAAQDTGAFIRQVRAFETDSSGPLNPVGLAYSANARAFFVVQDRTGAAPGSDTDLLALDAFSQLAGSARIAAAVQDPINMAFDNKYDRLLIYQAQPNQLLEVTGNPVAGPERVSVIRHNLKIQALGDPQGMAVDDGTGAVYILDASVSRVVRLEPGTDGNLEDASFSEIDLGASGLTAVRGIAFDPSSGLLHAYSLADRHLYELSASGRVLADRDLTTFGLKSPQALVIAPSGDQTDDPKEMNLFIADSGLISGRAQSSQLNRRRQVGSRLAAVSQDPGQIVEMSFVQAAAAQGNFTSSLIRTTDLSQVDPPSPDPSGLAYVTDSNSLIMDDGEVEETVSGKTHFEGANVWELTLLGAVIRTANVSDISPVTMDPPMSNEPTGIAWNPSNGHYYFSDDSSGIDVYDLDPGDDGLVGTGDDSWTGFDGSFAGNGDAEGIAYDSWNNHVFVADGINREVYEYDLTGSLINHFDVQTYGVEDPESVEFNPISGTLFVMSSNSSTPVIVETTTTGELLQTIDISATGAHAAAGLAYAPASDGSESMHFYIVDRGVDNNSNPDIIDGKMYELSAPTPISPGNQPPSVDAGPDQTISLPNDLVNLDGTVSDDGNPDPPGTITTTWSQVSGPGTVTFGDPNAVDTTASFAFSGTYVLQLAASDSEWTTSDAVTITVNPDPSVSIFSVRVGAGSDDAEESTSGTMDLTSSDLELVYDGNNQTVGMRFNGINVPQGATITRAYVQFTVDESQSESTSLAIQGQAVDNATTFTSTSGNISSRTKTSASVAWNPNPWNTVGAAGLDQQTPDLSAVIQEIVSRSGWASGNSLAIIITGTGHRTADSYNGSATTAPLLYLEYTIGGNQPPVATGDSYTTAEDTLLIIPAPGVLGNDNDPDGDPLTAVLNSGPSNGSLTLSSNGSFSYTPNPNFNGGDSFTYHANDGALDSNVATVSITVNAVNDPPVAVDDSATTSEDTDVVIDVLANDSDVDGDSLTVASVTQGGNGSVSNNGADVTYTPNAGYSGGDSFSYTVSDGNGGTATANVSVTVTPADNNPPVAVDDSATTDEDTPVTIDVLANDSDLDGDSLTVASVTQGGNGTVTNNNADVTYTPNADFNGSDSFSYTVSDGNGGTDTANVSVTVTPVNDPPAADDKNVATDEDTPVDIILTGSDPDGDPLTFSVGSGPAHGALNGTAPDLTYTPQANYNGPDSFTYTANDGAADSNVATVSITVNAVNVPPTAMDDSYTTDSGVTLNVSAPGVLANDSDPENNPLMAGLVSGVSNGSLTLNADGSFSYTSNANFSGSDSFTYRANDGGADSNVATVTITVNAVASTNDALATGETSVAGTVSGDYMATHDDDGVAESITERQSGGKPSTRYSYLEHKWTFNVAAGSVVTLNANAWSGGSSDGDSFIFAYSTDDSNYIDMFSVDNNSSANTQLSYVLPSSTQGTVYIRVTDSNHFSGQLELNTVFVDTLVIRSETQPGNPPAAPSALSATAISAGQIDLSWTDNATDEDGFYIQRSGDGSNWSLIDTIGADETSYTDSTVFPGTTYSYRVRAYNASGSSAYSNTASAATPAGLTLTGAGYKVKGVQTVDLEWSGSTATSFDIYRNGNKLISGVPGSSYTDNIGLKGSGTYEYQVCEAGSPVNCSNVIQIIF